MHGRPSSTESVRKPSAMTRSARGSAPSLERERARQQRHERRRGKLAEAPRTPARRRIGAVAALASRCALLVALSSIALLASPASSFAGAYRVYSCRIPTGAEAGAPAPLEAVETDTPTPGAWNRISSGAVEYGNTCSGGGSLMAALEAGVPHSTGDSMTWEYTAPQGESIVKATLWRAGDTEGGSGYLFWLAAQSDPSYSELITSSVAFDSCAFSAGCFSQGKPFPAMGEANRYEAPASRLGSAHFYVNIACSVRECASGVGDEEGYAAIFRIYSTEMELEESSAPVVANVSGELATASSLKGEAGLEFRAEDEGSGVYQEIVEVDGSVVQRTIVDEDGGRCVPVAEAGASVPAFLYPRPCPASVVGHVSLDTTKLAEGEHSLRVLVTNAAGDETPVVERKIDVHNASSTGGGAGKEEATGEPSEGAGEGSSPGGEGTAGGGTSGGTGGGAAGGGASAGGGGGAGGASGAGSGATGGSASTQSSGAGGLSVSSNASGGLVGPLDQFSPSDTPNGSPASTSARLEAFWSGGGGDRRSGASTASQRRNARRHRGASAHRSGKMLAISYGGKARLAGRLVTATGQPIAGARVEVEEVPAYGGAHAVPLGTTHTNKHGAFRFTLIRDASSGRIELTYASSLGGTPSAQKSLKLTVTAGVHLVVKPRHTSVGRTIRLSGKVLGGPIPHGGKEIVLEARSTGTRWLQFDVLRTNGRGRFAAKHRFRLPGPIRYSFRAVSPGEADFPYATGASKAVSVWER